MERLFVTADIHGSLSSWITIKELMRPKDSLVIAGDLFDTRYGNYSPDFQPEFIKKEIQAIPNKVYYVYGNCDVPSFFPGHGPTLGFKAFKKNFFLHHGHRQQIAPATMDIIIQGHTHRWFLEKKENQIFMNPGSICNPRNLLYTYGIIDKYQVKIIDLKATKSLATIDF
ncbi:MAG: YfcE family phosphodiesterase [Desulfobacula sp.]|jgi:putative phosphoesterase|nr:YfcE family phosphodiesterase [Desulfobacula sp.]